MGMTSQWIARIVLASCLLSCSIAVRVDLRKYSWQHPILPNLKSAMEIVEGEAEFYGHVGGGLHIDCDLDCQIAKGRLPIHLAEIEREMSYETLDVEKRLRVKTIVNVTDIPSEILTPEHHQEESVRTNITRRKRAIFGYDTQFTLSTKKFSTMFPFSTVVKLSTGCAGVKISPTHVLTSAHCIHDGNKYLKGVKKLRIGQFTKKIKKVRKGKGRKGKGQKKNRKQDKSVTVNRSKRSSKDAPQAIQKFRWTRAKRTHLPQAWLKAKNQRSEDVAVEYDYAVIELKRPLGKEFMKMGISPDKDNLPGNRRVHFTAFDRSKSPQLLYRYCGVEEQSNDMIYHYCDAERGSTGAGIYVRLYDQEHSTWDRRVIGVYSGHQWIEKEDSAVEYNTGVRITPLKFAQICFWTTGDYAECRGG